MLRQQRGQSTHLELQQRGRKVQQVRRQEGPVDAPVALGGARHEAHGLPRAQQRRVMQQLRPVRRCLCAVPWGALRCL